MTVRIMGFDSKDFHFFRFLNKLNDRLRHEI